MSTVLADPPAPPAAGSSAGDTASAPAAPPELHCPNCQAALAPAQDWCLECGYGSPGGLGPRSGWRPAAAIVAATTVLALGAVGASYAALSAKTKHVIAHPPAVALAPVPGGPTATPPPAPPQIPTHAATPPVGAGAAAKHVVAPPASRAAPTVAPGAAVVPPTGTPSTITPAPTTTGSTAPPATPANEIMLDTNAASTYNPSGLSADQFGDPGAAIDSDPATAWTAQADPASAPALGAGVLLDLKSRERVSALKLVTATRRMTVEILGSSASTAPTTPSDPGWSTLAGSRTVRANQRIKLQHAASRVRYVLVFVTKVPPGKSAADISEITLLR